MNAEMLRKSAVAVCVVAAMQALSGCNGFFVYPGSTTTTTNTTVGNVAYVSDSLSGAQYINGYSIGSGTLAAATGSPYNLTYTPLAMVVTPSDGLLYVAAVNGEIYAYTIGAGGALTAANSGAAVAGELAAAMDVTPDGKSLLVLDGTSVSSPFITQYTINSTTGALTSVGQFGFGTLTQTVTLQSLKVAPSGDFFAVSLGQQGDFVFPYIASSATVGTTVYNIPTGTTAAAPLADSALAIDGGNNLFIARNGSVQVYAVSTAGVPSSQATGSVAVSNAAPYSLATGTGGYLFEGSANASQIANYVVGGTASAVTLTPVTGSPASPTTAPSNVAALAKDSSGVYIVAAGLNSVSGTQLFKIDSNGGLTSLSSQGTLTGSSAVTPVIAMTH